MTDPRYKKRRHRRFLEKELDFARCERHRARRGIQREPRVGEDRVECALAHFRHRMFERFGVHLRDHDVEEISRIVRNGGAGRLENIGVRPRFRVQWRGLDMIVVWSDRYSVPWTVYRYGGQGLVRG